MHTHRRVPAGVSGPLSSAWTKVDPQNTRLYSRRATSLALNKAENKMQADTAAYLQGLLARRIQRR